MRILGLVVAAFMGLSLAPAAGHAATAEKLRVTTSSGVHTFDVEVMETEAERERGLMFRKSMAADHGMLFNFGKSQLIYMWMKNTLLPLDMVFIDAHGTVVNIAEDTVPMSEAVIASGEPVLSVLEVNAGTARTIKLKKGDKVSTVGH